MSQRSLKPVPMRWNSLLNENIFSLCPFFQSFRRSLNCALALACAVLIGSGFGFSAAQTAHEDISAQSGNSQASNPNSKTSSPQRPQAFVLGGIVGSKPTPMMWLPAGKVKLHLKSDPLPIRSLLPSSIGRYKVAVVLTIGIDGKVSGVRCKKDLSDAPHEVIEAAIQSVSARTYRPFVSDGKPTEVFADLTLSHK